DVDDRSRPALAHPWRNQLHQPERTLQNDLDHLVEHAFIDIEAGRLRHIRARVIDEDIDPSELAHNGVHHSFDLFALPDVTDDRLYGRPDLARDVLQRVSLAAADDHARTLADKCFRNGPADPAARAGDNGNFVLQHVSGAARSEYIPTGR